jgi:hypothetical protein
VDSGCGIKKRKSQGCPIKVVEWEDVPGKGTVLGHGREDKLSLMVAFLQEFRAAGT